MKNDYSKYQFWEKIQNNKKVYYIKVKNQLVEVNKEVYVICRNSYKKMNYEIKKDIDNPHYSDINHIDLYGFFSECNFVDKIYLNDIKEILCMILIELNKNEFYIIYNIYFCDMKEIEVAKKLGISQQRLNYQKKKNIKKIKENFVKTYLILQSFMKSICFLWEEAEVEKSKVFICYRVLNYKSKNLLNCQENKLRELVYFLKMNIVTVVKDVSNSKSLYVHRIQLFFYYITSQKIDSIAVYDQTRIYIFNDLYAEVQMICDKYNGEIVTVNNMKELCNIQLF